jgi:hypothetical protein
MVPSHAARDARLLDVRIGISGVEVVDVFPELILELRPLAAPQQVRLIETNKAADARALSCRGSEVDVARSLFP